MISNKGILFLLVFTAIVGLQAADDGQMRTIANPEFMKKIQSNQDLALDLDSYKGFMQQAVENPSRHRQPKVGGKNIYMQSKSHEQRLSDQEELDMMLLQLQVPPKKLFGELWNKTASDGVTYFFDELLKHPGATEELVGFILHGIFNTSRPSLSEVDKTMQELPTDAYALWHSLDQEVKKSVMNMAELFGTLGLMALLNDRSLRLVSGKDPLGAGLISEQTSASRSYWDRFRSMLPSMPWSK